MWKERATHHQTETGRQAKSKQNRCHAHKHTHTHTHLPSTANISVFVKCLYKVSFTTLRRRRSVRVVWIRLEKMWLQSRKLVQIKTTNCPPNSVTALASCCPVVDTHTTSPQTATLYFTPYQDASVFWSICTPVSVQQNLQTHSTEVFFLKLWLRCRCFESFLYFTPTVFPPDKLENRFSEGIQKIRTHYGHM